MFPGAPGKKSKIKSSYTPSLGLGSAKMPKLKPVKPKKKNFAAAMKAIK